MYINFWYPICRTNELTDEAPVRSKLLGTQYVVFRDSQGKAHVLSDTCVHRGGSLSKGKVVEDCIECPYHGWQFDTQGHCIDIPTVSEKVADSLKPKAQLVSLKVQESLGLVWVHFGEKPDAVPTL